MTNVQNGTRLSWGRASFETLEDLSFPFVSYFVLPYFGMSSVSQKTP